MTSPSSVAEATVEQKPSPVGQLRLSKPSDATFQVAPNSPAGMTLAGLRGDPTKEPATMMVKLTPGCAFPYHWHNATEEFVILQGSAVLQFQGQDPVELNTGAYAQIPSRKIHRFRSSSPVDCYILVIGDRAYDIAYFDEAGREISADDALAGIARDGHKDW